MTNGELVMSTVMKLVLVVALAATALLVWDQKQQIRELQQQVQQLEAEKAKTR